MATALQLLYLRHRVGGRRHYAALGRVSRDTGLDPATIERCLHRARLADEQDARQKKRGRRS